MRTDESANNGSVLRKMISVTLVRSVTLSADVSLSGLVRNKSDGHQHPEPRYVSEQMKRDQPKTSAGIIPPEKQNWSQKEHERTITPQLHSCFSEVRSTLLSHGRPMQSGTCNSMLIWSRNRPCTADAQMQQCRLKHFCYLCKGQYPR